jgi:methyl-accepting chemotaxis protein
VEVPVPERREVVTALAGSRATATRYARRPQAVYLFLAEPVRHEGKVVAAVYVTRSTQPVLEEMHRVRTGLIGVLALTLVLTAAVTITLALTISRPLERLARAARRISAGDARALGTGGEAGFSSDWRLGHEKLSGGRVTGSGSAEMGMMPGAGRGRVVFPPC